MAIEYHMCDSCGAEFTIEKELTFTRQPICPNGCDKFHDVYLGETLTEKERIKTKYLTEKNKSIEINPNWNEEVDEYEERRPKVRHCSVEQGDLFNE